jgi:steroid 5-alpha reductase family enzyme
MSLTLHDRVVNGYFSPEFHGAVYIAISALVSLGVQLGAVLADRRIGTRRSGDAVLACMPFVVCWVSLITRGLYFPRQIIASSALSLWSLARAARFARLTRSDHEDISLTKHVSHTAGRTMWCTLITLPVVLLNLAIDYGRGPGLFAEPTDRFVVVGLAASFAGCVWSYEESIKWDNAHGKEHSMLFACNSGPWAWARHPDHFFDVGFHILLFVLCYHHVPLVAFASPFIVIYDSLKASAHDELKLHGRLYSSASYRQWKSRTSPFCPIPPALYVRVPWSIKRAFMGEFRAFESADCLAASFHDR